MKLIGLLVVVLIPLLVIIAAEFSSEGSVLSPVKENINDKLHVYREGAQPAQNVVSDAFDIDARLRAELNESFPGDMADFISRFEDELSKRETIVGQTESIAAIRTLLSEAKLQLATESEEGYQAAEMSVRAAISSYLDL